MTNPIFNDVRGYVFIKTVPGSTFSVQNAISGLDGVIFVAVLTGEYDLLVGVAADNMETLGNLVVNKIATLDNVVETETALVAGFAAGQGSKDLAIDGRSDGP